MKTCCKSDSSGLVVQLCFSCLTKIWIAIVQLLSHPYLLHFNSTLLSKTGRAQELRRLVLRY